MLHDPNSSSDQHSKHGNKLTLALQKQTQIKPEE